MNVLKKGYLAALCLMQTLLTTGAVFGDESFDKLFQSGAFKEALDYADEKLAVTDRDENTWVRIAIANDTLGFQEKALASFLVAWRLNPKSTGALLGIARVYNNMKQSDDALTWAQKAFDAQPSAEAGWEYAKACIALNRASEAKSALEKVIQADPRNSVANKALGLIYFDERNWTGALPLLKKSIAVKPDPDLTLKSGKAHLYSGNYDSAIVYLNRAVSAQVRNDDVYPDLGRAYFAIKKYDLAFNSFEKTSIGQLTADDLYKYAFSKETATGRSAVKEYESALDKFGTSTTPEALKTREKIGRQSLDEKNYTKAVGHFRFITGVDTGGKIIPSGFILLADALKGSGDVKNAITMLEHAIAVNKNNVEAYVKLGELYQQSGADENAKKILQRLISLSPNDPVVYLKLGNYSLNAGNASEALTYFQKSTSLKKSAEALSGIAAAYLKLKNNDNALDAAKQALDLNKNDIKAHQVAAQIYFEKNDYRNAQPQLEFLASQMATDIELLAKLSTCYKNNGESAKLLALDSKIVLISSDNIESRKRLAARADSLQLPDSARILYTQLSVLDPKDAFSFKRLFQIAAASNDLPASVTMQFNRYVAIKNDDADAFRDYGDFLYGTKNMDGALKAYRRALELNPQIKGFHKRYAEIVIAKGQEDEAIMACTKLIAAGEADAGIYSTLGSIYLKKKNYLKAVEMYQNALQLAPTDVNLLGDLADVQLLSGDKKSAAISYEQIVMMNSGSVKEYKVLGDIYMSLSRNDEAVKAYKKYNEKMPTDAGVAVLLGREAYADKAYTDVVKYLWREGIVLESPENLILGEALLESGKFREAIIPLEKVKTDKKKLDKKSLERTLMLLAGAYEKSGHNTDAAAVYGEYLTLPGVNDPDASYKRACLLESSDPVVALRLFESNIRTYPADYRNFLKAGTIMSSKKETLGKSVEYLRRVTELASEKPDVWLEMARVYGKLRKTTEELDAYKRFAESNPQSIEANSRIGTLLMQKGLRNEAMVYLELANTLKPDDPDIMILLAEGYQRTGRINDAVDLLVKAKTKRPEEGSLSLALFDCYVATNQKDKALAEIKALIDKSPMTEYKVKYAEYLSTIGKNHEASELLEAILAEEPENFDVMMLQAKALRAEKKYDEAVEIYKSINSLMPDHIMSMFERAETHMEQSKLQWADMFYNRVLKIDPQFALAELGLAKIAKIKKDQNAYHEHLDKARALDPENKRILEEFNQK